MKTFSKKIIAALLASVMVLSVIGAQVVLSSAANYSTSYGSYTTPADSGDYAYWNGSKVVRSSNTSVSEVKWMQCALNYCIVNGLLSATKLDVDGSFGPASKSATLAFQKKYGLSQDGSFGSATIKKMKEVLKKSEDSKKTSTSASANISASSVKTQITSTYSSAKKLAGVSNFSGKCGNYVKSQLHVLGVINKSKDTDCAGNGNKFYNNVKSGKTSTGYTKTKVSGGSKCLTNLVNTYGKNIGNIVISYPHQYGYTNSNPGAGHVVFIHAIINGTVYYSDNYKVGSVPEGEVLTKTVANFDSAYTNSYGNAIGAIYFHK